MDELSLEDKCKKIKAEIFLLEQELKKYENKLKTLDIDTFFKLIQKSEIDICYKNYNFYIRWFDMPSKYQNASFEYKDITFNTRDFLIYFKENEDLKKFIKYSGIDIKKINFDIVFENKKIIDDFISNMNLVFL